MENDWLFTHFLETYFASQYFKETSTTISNKTE